MSLKPTFKIGSHERILIDEEFISNGHWAIRRDCAVRVSKDLKPFKSLLSVQHGHYSQGIGEGVVGKCPDIGAIFPKDLTPYIETFEQLDGVEFGFDDEVSAFKIKSLAKYVDGQKVEESFTVGIDPKYMPLLRVGKILVRDPKSPIIATDNDGSVLCVVMPRGLKE